MWSNLRDVRSIAEKITNVVAPPTHHDDTDDVDDDDYDDDQQSEEDGDEEYSTENEDDAPRVRNPFGFVDMITRAMDSNDQRYERDESNSERHHKYENDVLGTSEDNDNEQIEIHTDDEDEVDFQSMSLNESRRPLSDDVSVHAVETSNHEHSLHTEESTNSGLEQVSSSGITLVNQSGLGAGASRRKHLPRDDSMDDTSTYISPPVFENYESAEHEPVRLSLVRESGSVSPQSRKTKLSVLDRDVVMAQLNASPPLSSRSLGSTPCGKEILLSPLSDILHAQQKELTVQPTHKPEKDTTKSENSSNNVAKFPRDALLGSFSVANKELEEEGSNQYISLEQSNLVVQHDMTHPNDVMSQKVENCIKSDKKNANVTVTTLPSIVDESSEGEDKSAREAEVTSTNLLSPSLETSASDHVQINGDLPTKNINLLDSRCKELQMKLELAEDQIVKLQQQASIAFDKETAERDNLMQHFQEKESRLLQAAADEHNHDIQILQQELSDKISSMQDQFADERNSLLKERDSMQIQLQHYQNMLEQLETQTRQQKGKSDTNVEQIQQQHVRAVRKLEEKISLLTAREKERDKEIITLKETIQKLESKVVEQNEGEHEAEEEIDELHTENDALHDHIERLQSECSELRTTISKLEADSEQLVHLKMELRMLKEDHSREKAKIQTVAASAESSTIQLEAERDEALAKVHDLQLQLSAAIADINIAKSDTERIQIANVNLQAALEAFQNERDSEIAMMEENRREQEQAMAAAQAAALNALHEANQMEMRQLQRASDAALLNSMDEIKKLEEKLEKFRIENVQTRRSLDEAIKRLQATQDDVIDRTFMKNILLDWLTKSERKEKMQVLELMASVLHFTEAEKERVHVDDGGGLRKLVAPPPPKVDLEQLEGDNVREKWVNFLIAEADD